MTEPQAIISSAQPSAKLINLICLWIINIYWFAPPFLYGTANGNELTRLSEKIIIVAEIWQSIPMRFPVYLINVKLS